MDFVLRDWGGKEGKGGFTGIVSLGHQNGTTGRQGRGGLAISDPQLSPLGVHWGEATREEGEPGGEEVGVS